MLTEKHKHILEKAEILFAKKGFEGTTVRDIAQAAEVNLAMISYYFGSKEKLMEALFRERMAEVKFKIEAVVQDSNIGPFHKLEMLIDQYIIRVFQNQAFYKVMLIEQVQNQNVFILAILRQYKAEVHQLITSVIKEGLSTGEFKNETDPMLLFSTMIGTVLQMVINKEYYAGISGYKEGTKEDYDEFLKSKLSVYIKSLFKATLVK